MEVYEFKKNFLTRLLETTSVLNGGGTNIPASAIRSEWINLVEVAVEPTGWQALWKASRPVCEQLGVKYPLVVLGTVDQVLFDELKASFLIEAIQDDDVQLPEEQITVDLEELWPLREQNNPALNVNITAECIDKLRFFYQHLWMPWDNDTEDEHGWIDKHLESRIRFCHDLKNKTMSRQLSSHALALLAEARYIQRKRTFIEQELSEAVGEEEEEEEDNEASILKDDRSGELLQLNLRLNTIKNEINILENPVMRNVFEKVRFGAIKDGKGSAALMAYIVTQAVPIDEQLTYLQRVKTLIEPKLSVKMCDSLQHALDHCSPDSAIYLPPATRQDIKFLEYLNSDGSFRGVSDVSFVEDFDKASKMNPTIASKNDDSVLLTIDGDFTLENIQLDCSNVRTGVVIKKGNIVFRNCCFTGDPNSSTKQGIVIFGNCTITFDRCLIKEFSTGIYSNHDCTINLINSTISHCMTGLETLDQCQIAFRSTSVTHCTLYGVLLEDFNDDGAVDRTGSGAGGGSQVYEDYNTIERQEFTFEGGCEFRDNAKGNFVIRKGFSERFNSSCFVDEDESQLHDMEDGLEESVCNTTNVSFCDDYLEASKLSSTKHIVPPAMDKSDREEQSASDTGVSGSLSQSEDDLSATGYHENSTQIVRDVERSSVRDVKKSEQSSESDDCDESEARKATSSYSNTYLKPRNMAQNPPEEGFDQAEFEDDELGEVQIETSSGRKRLFSKELRCMMYGFGDDQNPYTESVDLLEDLVVEFITEMTHRAMEIGRTGRVQVEDIVFLVRKNSRKYARVKDLLTMNEELKRARKAFDEIKYAGAEAKIK
uniref:Transcription initiation factor TFIID subunit 13 n=2 Tax=Anopheles TaxID=7164 RepID=A0A182P4V8_9DIPT